MVLSCATVDGRLINQWLMAALWRPGCRGLAGHRLDERDLLNSHVCGNGCDPRQKCGQGGGRELKGWERGETTRGFHALGTHY
jgi:hypothetical protein